eukprot:XP_001696043.1 predicted protein [Chlamydomonas reinhardtii]
MLSALRHLARLGASAAGPLRSMALGSGTVAVAAAAAEAERRRQEMLGSQQEAPLALDSSFQMHQMDKCGCCLLGLLDVDFLRPRRITDSWHLVLHQFGMMFVVLSTGCSSGSTRLDICTAFPLANPRLVIGSLAPVWTLIDGTGSTGMAGCSAAAHILLRHLVTIRTRHDAAVY